MSHIANTVEIPFNITGGVIEGRSSSADTLSGYTNALTTFECVLSPSGVPNYISNDALIWDFGDGTYVQGFSAEHVYTVPGRYVVSLVGYSSAGKEYLSTQTKQVSVSNLYTDSLVSVLGNTYNLITVPAGKITTSNAVPIVINRHNSWQSYRVLSATNTDYTLILGASGSRSNKLSVKDYYDNKWIQVDNTWSCYKSVTATDLTISYEPIDSINTTNELIYYQKSIVKRENALLNPPEWYDSMYTRVPASLAPTLSTTALVGTSGVATIYYADDIPVVGSNKVFLHAVLNTSNLPDRDNILDHDFVVIDNGIEYYSHGVRVSVPITVSNTSPTKLLFTSNGIASMQLSTNKWQNTRIPFMINLSTEDNSITNAFAPLLINPISAPGDIPVTDTGVVNLSVTNSTGTSLISTEFFRTNDDQLPTYLSGAYRGVFIPRDIGENVKLIGQSYILIPSSFSKQIIYGWVGNPAYNSIYLITSMDVIGEVVTWGKSEQAVGPEDTFPIITLPITGDLDDLTVKGHICDSRNGTISSYDITNTTISGINLQSIEKSGGFDHGQTINLTDKSGGGSFPAVHPSCLAANSNKDFWITMPDSNLIAKISDSTGKLLTYLQDWPSSKTNSAVPTVSGGGYMIEPSIVDVDTSGNIWVAYTQKLSSFIVKYDDEGNELLSYDFPQYIVPQDMVVDKDDNVWVTTSNQSNRQSFTTLSKTISAWRHSDGKSIVYALPTGTDLSSVTAGNPIVDMQWSYDNRKFGGKLLVNSADNNPGTDAQAWLGGDYPYFTVQPYTGRANNISQSVRTIASTVGNFYRSDRVFKFNSSGTLVHDISGFYNPTYTIVDDNQDCWVCHDVNTLSKINRVTAAVVNYRVETDSYITDFTALSAGAYNVQQLGGIGGDTNNALFVINSYENKVFKYEYESISGTINTGTSASTTINASEMSGSDMYRSFGDWSGWRWVNKFARVAGGIEELRGEATFNILTSGGEYKAAILHEDFDPAETIKSYRFQSQLLQHGKLFDSFYGQIVGSADDEPTTLGKSTYSNIANFASKHSDIDECDINTLYSLCEQYGTSITNYNLNFTGGLKRIMNITSIPHKKLWGTRSTFNRDFAKSGTTSLIRGVNLGSEISPISSTINGLDTDNSTYAYTVTAGVPIIAEQLFNKEFSIITTAYVSGETTDPGYASSVGMLSSYPLSSYSLNWGWNLYYGVNGTDIIPFYKFYEYVPLSGKQVQLEGVIDWGNSYTNLVEANSGHNEWIKDGGIVDTMIDYELRRGLDLFMPTVSASSSSLR